MTASKQAHEAINRIERHCERKIEPRRLRFHIVQELQREIEKRQKLKGFIERAINDNND